MPSSTAPTQLAGWPVPGTHVSLARAAAAGSTVQGKAPPGSVVDIQGQTLTVPESGVFSVSVPDRPGTRLPVRIQRPGATAITLLIDIVAASP